MTTLYWFRNDLRLHDNPALHQACQQAEHVLPVILADQTELSVTPWGFARQGPHRTAFRWQAAKGLSESLKARGSTLLCPPEPGLEGLLHFAQRHGVKQVVCETIDAPSEQADIEHLKAAGLQVTSIDQSTLLPMDELPFEARATPTVFTAFRQAIEKAGTQPKAPLLAPDTLPGLPDGVDAADFWQTRDETRVPTPIGPAVPRGSFPYSEAQWQGSEACALAHVARYFESGLPRLYKTTRNGLMGTDYSTKFSPWLAIGALSPRTIWSALRAHEASQGPSDGSYWIWFELLWRDHFRLMMRRFGSQLFAPRGLASKPHEPNTHDPQRLAQWIEGQTGQPFVDAGMRELKMTGYLSNRLRQNVASYLIHEMQGDWRAGAAWFEHALIDYDVSSNQGNWAYIAGVGTDPRGGRRFNVAKQAKDYDQHGEYQHYWSDV